MALFPRRTRPPRPAPVAEFWRWWAGGGAAACTAAADDPAALGALLAAPVSAIDPSLSWEVGSGPDTGHTLTLSGGGDPVLRRVAERWRAAGPAEATGWTFHPARPPAPDVAHRRVDVDGVAFDLGDARIAADLAPGGTRLDVRVFHPGFAAVAERTRAAVVFRLLDLALGEDDVERWLGTVEPVTGPLGHDDVGALCNDVARLASRRPAGEGWAELVGELGGLPAAVRTRPWLHRLDHPLFDLTTRLTLGYTADGRGQPLAGEATRLAGVEAEIARATADGIPGAVLVTVLTVDGARHLLLVSDSDDADTTDALCALARRVGAAVEQVPDPGWRQAQIAT